MNDIGRPPLPKSLRSKRNKAILSRVIPCFILLIACVVILVLWGERLFRVPSSDFIIVQKILYVLFLLLPFVITGVPLKLIDSSWDGVIADVKVRERIGTYSRAPGKPGMYTRHDLILTVIKSNGKKKKYVALSLGKADFTWQNPPIVGKIAYHVEKYPIGAHVYKYYGFKQLYLAPSHDEDRKICIVCSTTNKNQDTTCGYCHSDLIQ